MNTNAHTAELNYFGGLAARWWDPDGPSRPLMALNPVRLAFIEAQHPLAGAHVCDVGCGGGLLSEAMALAGARVLGLDLTPELIEVATLHALGEGLQAQIEYRLQSAESLAESAPGTFDVVTCMEMLEHVPDPAAILRACVALLKPGGTLVLSTLNRTPKAFALGVVAAEYVLNLVPKGTHRYGQFLKPAELASVLRSLGMQLTELRGMAYAPVQNTARLSEDYAINYIMAARSSLAMAV
jgi:2-polyprenyl-6-hydroxyphenyl methylase / 3-demethylubiquinone-9 3-methyltransferase